MKPLRGSVVERGGGVGRDFFDLISSAESLPEWNEHIHHVVDAPAGEARPGDEWVVEIRAMGTRWNSRSRIKEVDRDGGRFALLSQTDDGNPSDAIWRWEVTAADRDAGVRVTWELYPKSFWRKVLISRIRHRQLKQEVRGLSPPHRSGHRIASAQQGS
jgi:hypothetical protein